MKRGITISILAVTVVIMFIIISVTTVVGTKSIANARYEENISKIKRVSDAVAEYILKNKSLPITGEIIGKSNLSDRLREELTANGDINSNLYEVDIDLLAVNTVIGNGTSSNKDIFLVAEDTNNVYYLKGFSYKGTEYYTYWISTM